MVITITHHEDRERAGYAWRVQFHDRTIPELRGSAPTLAGVQQMLTTLLDDRKRPRKRRPLTPPRPPRRAAPPAADPGTADTSPSARLR
jgi:hypothetical protein